MPDAVGRVLGTHFLAQRLRGHDCTLDAVRNHTYTRAGSGWGDANDQREPMTLLRVCLVVALAAIFGVPSASAHRHGCHSHRTCPSDHHNYRWRGLVCTSYRAERLKRDTIVIRHQGRRYWCHR
jgi:hypothetical protein